jgi:hypothetical protein
MARRQTRRTVSLSRAMHQASASLAAARGITHAHLVEQALKAFGVQAELGVHMTREQAEHAMNGRRRRVLSRDGGVAWERKESR